MSNTDKDIVITPNRGSTTADPTIRFTGGNANVAASVNVSMYADGTLSFEGTAGQLFSITNSLSGTIFSVNDVSGIPSIEVLDSGVIKLAEYGGNVGIGTSNAQWPLHVEHISSSAGNVGAIDFGPTAFVSGLYSKQAALSKLTFIPTVDTNWETYYSGLTAAVDLPANSSNVALSANGILAVATNENTTRRSQLYNSSSIFAAQAVAINSGEAGYISGINIQTVNSSNVYMQTSVYIQANQETGNCSYMYGINNNPYVTGGTVYQLYGSTSIPQVDYSATITDSLIGHYISPSVSGAAIVNKRYGVFIDTFGNAVTADDYAIYSLATQPSKLSGNIQATSFSPTGTTIPVNGMYLPATNRVSFATNSTERLTVDSNGNVGIGTASPTVTFDVVGTTRIKQTVDSNTSVNSAGRLVFEGINTSNAVKNNKVLGSVIFGGNPDTTGNVAYPVSISAVSEGDWTSSTNAPAALVFRTGFDNVNANLTDGDQNYWYALYGDKNPSVFSNVAGMSNAVFDSTGNLYVLGGLNYVENALIKYNKYGEIVWQKKGLYASADLFDVDGLAVDTQNNVIAGYSANNFTYLVKHDSDGTILWQRSLAFSQWVYITDICTDSSNNIYATGVAYDGSVQNFLVKYNSSGTLQWQKALTGDLGSFGVTVAIDPIGSNLYISGQCWISGFRYAYIAQYSSSGTLNWQRTLGSSGTYVQYSVGLDCDSSGNAYITFCTNTGLTIIAKYNSSGTIQWQKQVAVALGGYGVAASVTDDDKILIFTTSYSSTGNGLGVIAQFDTSGNLLWQRGSNISAWIWNYGRCLTTTGNVFAITGTAFRSTAYTNGKGVTAILPTDGSLVGDFKDFTYMPTNFVVSSSTLTDAAGTFSGITPTYADAAGNLTVGTQSYSNNLTYFKQYGSEKLRISASGEVTVNGNLFTSGELIVSNGITVGRGGNVETTSYNLAFGEEALYNNSTGYDNTGIGHLALWSNTDGYANTAIGILALSGATTGSRNTIVGRYAGKYITTGNVNTMLGSYDWPGTSLTTGSRNTFLGGNSGSVITTGNSHVIIGSYNGNSSGLDIRTTNNYIVLSDGDGNLRQVIDNNGNVGIATVSPTSSLHVGGIAQATAFVPTGSTVPTNGMYLSATNKVSFATNGIERLSIDSTGNVLMERANANAVAFFKFDPISSPGVSIGGPVGPAYMPAGAKLLTVGTIDKNGDTIVRGSGTSIYVPVTTQAVGNDFGIDVNITASNYATPFGVRSTIYNTSSGQNSYGFYANVASTSGTAYAFYADKGISYFGGNIQISGSSNNVGIIFSDGSFLKSATGIGTSSSSGNASSYSSTLYTYEGDGTTTIFSTSPSSYTDKNNTMIYISGVYQRKSTYTWAGTNITFDAAPVDGAAIEINVVTATASPTVATGLTVTGNLSVSGTSTLTGNVGIGTTTPRSTLQVEKISTATGNSGVNSTLLGYCPTISYPSGLLYTQQSALNKLTLSPSQMPDGSTIFTGLSGFVDQPSTNTNWGYGTGVLGASNNSNNSSPQFTGPVTVGSMGIAINSGNADRVSAINGYAEITSGNANRLYGADIEAFMSGGNAVAITGVYASPYVYNANVTSYGISALNALPVVGSGANVTGGLYGIVVQPYVYNGSTVDSRYGIYIDTMGAAVTGNDYAIYSLATQPSKFSGNIQATSFSPTGTTIPVNGIYLPATNRVSFATNTTERLTIDSNGNVGINTSSPAVNLHVIGSQIITGNVGIGTSTIAGITAGTALAAYTGNLRIGTATKGIVYSDGSFQTAAPAGTVVGTTDTQTLTNKRINPRVSSTTSITSPLAWNSDSYDQYCATAQAADLTINADSGTPVDGQKMLFRIKDNGTTKNLTWTTGASKAFRAIGVTLPTATTASKTVYVGCVYNAADARWDVVAVAQEA